ncbi:hypothetical protein PSECIP111951_01401 [Pseudoalteromonas holothuriae]|uniref:YcxB-like C-terminal domain-containing protein n=1 Tax=Pseudoalteromonas holothuriae TaxID=2963714 RepID=A0ABM9GGI6_9GAMM|nr:YcxB family protein [Pseudoalteromonas sp. CIP111951]CAH9056140.1 hypothetical protein PSECIP111951_01401 [Pseudoalteromonas sp. CIP111951]
MMRIDFTLIIVTATPFVILIGAFLYNQNKLINQAVPFADGLILGEKTIEFKEDGIYEKSPLAKTFYDWKAVDSLEENSGTLYIFVDRVLALIVPIGSKGDNIEIIRAFVSKKLAKK